MGLFCYSNLFKQDGDEVSFYVGSTPNVKFQTFNSTNDTWNDGTTVLTGVTGGDVYAGEYLSSASNKLKNFAVYSEDFYIRTDAAKGGWANYIRDDQAMFQFSENAFFPNEWYNHYWCEWTATGTNVKAVVGNRINPAISDTLVDFYLTMSTNMRFEYDNRTNYIGRQFLKGSSGDFLRIYASDIDTENFIYLSDGTTRIKKANAQTFNDGSDWVYLIDVKAIPDGSDDVKCYVYGRYPVTAAGIGAASDQDNNLGGYDTDGTTPLPIKIMGKTTTPDTYKMRLIYDYKTNRLMAVWYPEGQELTSVSDITIDANFMMSRTDDEDPLTVSIANSGVKVMSINQMVSTLTITKSDYNLKKNNGVVYFYWISLPYNCRVKDIYGIGSYGKKWTVQRYRGDMRARYGFRHDITTFWANMKQNATAMMEANRGYVIRVQLTNDDFKEINGTSQVTLYFPSCNTSDIELQNSSTALTTTAPEWICEVEEPITGNSRRNWDSNWNVIGNPGMAAMEITSPTSLGSSDPVVENNSPNYYYKWSYSSASSSSNYTVTALSTENSFQPMYSYMVQYGGTITWQPQIKTIDPSVSAVVRRRTAEQPQADVLIALALRGAMLSDDSESSTYDRTYITLREGAVADFTLNQDLVKMGNDAPMIYSLFDGIETAGKMLPFETAEVPLVVVNPKVDSYLVENGLQEQPEEFIFALENYLGEKTVTLVDYAEDHEVVLNDNEYAVTLPYGTYSGRFALRITERTEVATSVDNVSNGGDAARILSDGTTIYLEGLSEPAEVTLYDVMGRMLFHSRVSAGERFEAPQMGVYLLQIGDKIEKIILK